MKTDLDRMVEVRVPAKTALQIAAAMYDAEGMFKKSRVPAALEHARQCNVLARLFEAAASQTACGTDSLPLELAEEAERGFGKL